jgi:hypothetical protein
MCVCVASHLSHLLSFIVIGVWKSNVTAIVQRVVVLKKMAKTVARYVKRITLTFFSSFPPTHFSLEWNYVHQMLMRYYTCLECIRGIHLFFMWIKERICILMSLMNFQEIFVNVNFLLLLRSRNPMDMTNKTGNKSTFIFQLNLIYYSFW